MKSLPLLLLSVLGVATAARSYTDSLGVTHTTDKDKPKIVIFAHRAVSLRHYGLGHDQLVGTYGEWYNSGSDVDVNNPEAGSSLPADPLHDDIKFLEKVVDLSPTCHIGYCTVFDIDTFMDLEVDELIVHGYLGSPWGLANETILEMATEKLGKPPIYAELSRTHADGADTCPDDMTSTDSKCASISMIDLVEEHYDLAKYLNLDVPDSLNDDRQTLCDSAARFQANMKNAQDKGVRVMAAYLTTTTSYIADPVSDSVLRMFEELGMPIVHPGACMVKEECAGNYFWEYMDLNTFFKSCPDGPENVAESCNDDPYYPVDMWLYDHRTTLKVTDPDFVTGFPDKAIAAGQIAYWPIGGRLLTARDAAEILDIVGPQVAKANRIHPATPCVSGVDVTGNNHRRGGFTGEYSCYNNGMYHNPKYLSECKFFTKEVEADDSEPVIPTSNRKNDKDGDDDAGGLSTGAIAAIGASAGFVVVGAVLFFLTPKSTTNKAGPIHEEQADEQFNDDNRA